MACRVVNAARLEVPLETVPPEKAVSGRPRAGVAQIPGVFSAAAKAVRAVRGH
jgi:hypothetical protein